jgi:hypothetical protein
LKSFRKMFLGGIAATDAWDALQLRC